MGDAPPNTGLTGEVFFFAESAAACPRMCEEGRVVGLVL